MVLPAKGSTVATMTSSSMMGNLPARRRMARVDAGCSGAVQTTLARSRNLIRRLIGLKVCCTNCLCADATEERTLDPLRWGLIPHWAEDPKIGYKTVNARVETVDTAPSYRQAFKKRRCLTPSDGF